MSPTLVSPPKIDRLVDAESRVVVHNIDWETYERLCDRTSEQHVHMTYDRGTLEFMSPSSRHEQYKLFSGHFIADLALEWGEPPDYRPFGEKTWRRAHVQKGLEADQCYYFEAAKQAVIAGRLPDRTDDPLPDIAVEIEISVSAVAKMAVYATLGFTEVWRCDGETASFQQLGPDGVYQPGEPSLFLPVTSDDWLQWLWQSDSVAGPNEWRRDFRAWIQDELRHRP